MKISTMTELTTGMSFLNPDDIDQTQPSFVTPCCIGAHLAGFLDVAEGNSSDYQRGADEFARLLDVSRAHVILLLREAGAPHDPFSTQKWETPVAEVWANLKKIEGVPMIRHADFSRCDLSEANLAYYDFTGATFHKANLTEAFLHDGVFENCDFSESNLSYAHVHGSDFKGANFALANMEGCFLHEAKDAKPMDEPPEEDWLL